MKLRACSAALAALSIATSASAEVETDKIIVTASRTAETVDETLASVSVITREDIERSQTHDILELLRSQGGVDVSRTGGPGQQTSVFLRGANAEHVLVLVDGVRAASATTGLFAWQNLDPAQIERIEIVRGPRASLYGSDAIGGVIQIFTRRNRGLDVAAEAGSFDTRGVQAGIGVGERHRFYANASTRRSNGFSATNPAAGTSYDADDDGNAQQSVNAGLDSRLTERLRLEVNAWQAALQTDFDPGASQSEADNRVFSARLRQELSDLWRHSLQVGQSRDELLSFGRGSSPYASQVVTSRSTFDWQHDLSLDSDTLLTLGIGRIVERGEVDDLLASTVTYDRDTDTNAVFVNGQTRLGAHDLQLSARADAHSEFGTHGSGQAAWGWALGKTWRSVLSYGTAFKAPTLNQLYHPGYSGWFAGNPDLQPEKSRSAEWSLRRHAGGSHARASLYYTRVTNLIAFEGASSQAINIGETSMRGAEFEYDLRAGAWSAGLNLAMQKAINEQTDADLLRRPRRKAALQLDYRFDTRSHAGAEIVAASEHQDIDNITYQTISVPGYAVVNLAGAIDVWRNLSLELRVDNLLDKEYEIVSGYNPSPRAGYLRVRYTTAH